MYTFWLVLFIFSGTLLCLTLLRNKHSVQWMGIVGLNIITAAFLLYFINWFGAPADFHLPLNGTTLATIGILGIPGLILLVTLKLIVV